MEEYANNYGQKKEDVLDRIQEALFPGGMEMEGTGYKRNILDRRIEKYLDKHFDEYIREFGLVRELDLEVYEEKYSDIVEGIKDIDEFQKDAEAKIASLERRLDRLESR